jgi:hypothetical protein
LMRTVDAGLPLVTVTENSDSVASLFIVV